MSPNSDNAMARFLFAILKQKNLRDIDWSQVAADPVLIEPIANGHAARMRFSRFRSTITGHKPTKRGRPSDKTRISKSKKETQSKKETPIKPEPGSSSISSYPLFSPESLASLTSPYMDDASPYLQDGDDFSGRFLTPCSDDMAQGLSISPSVLQDLHPTNGLMFPPLDGNSDFMNHAGHDHSFDVAFDLNRFATDVNSQGVSQSSGSQPLGDWDDRHF
ncbi:uncharacterized protein TrAFT101_001945 [Trichoderma asperellum]|uniref:Myb-like DNA-binding domain-containing protein n=1 Tax=Trichoderma asperellum (strain ATCC 204424 / CBS 433.97 / NBRC 101777) TaxID=1042311 RepID=A0A2T3ZF07_TRIA4|nr:hypothetical protein M441DRAFT_135045 [Trichoderma asperellum CBS 433.97]PTB43386.1 hypothetical protein M441DRAFT_135045 [Trichoderma asperellum CBS 433.97]UKZ86105.1 hypothetical protein TrAFT101_001945 [Trichoderma asperellum]